LRGKHGEHADVGMLDGRLGKKDVMLLLERVHKTLRFSYSTFRNNEHRHIPAAVSVDMTSADLDGCSVTHASQSFWLLQVLLYGGC